MSTVLIILFKKDISVLLEKFIQKACSRLASLGTSPLISVDLNQDSYV